MHSSFILTSVINHLQKGIVLANLITLFVYLQVTFVSFLYFSPDGITKFYGRLFLLLHHFTSHFLSDLKLSFCHFISLLFLILAFLIFLLLQMESINYLTKRSSLPIYGLLFGCIFILFFYIPSSYQISALREFWGTASYFIVFLFPVVFLLYMTLYQHWKRRRV